MQTLREMIQNKPDIRQKVITLKCGEETCEATIRRIQVGERKKLFAKYGTHTETPDHIGLGIEVAGLSLVPPMTIEEVDALPASIVDQITAAVNDFNGWTKKEQAVQADQFRPTAGDPVSALPGA